MGRGGGWVQLGMLPSGWDKSVHGKHDEDATVCRYGKISLNRTDMGNRNFLPIDVFFSRPCPFP